MEALKRGDWVRPVKNVKLDKHGTMLLADEVYLVGEVTSLYRAIDKYTDGGPGGSESMARLTVLKLLAELSGLPDIELVMVIVDTNRGPNLLGAKREDLMKVDRHG
jgi:hypothetical protein